MFPIGHLHKSEVKALAAAPGSPMIGSRILAKKESMVIPIYFNIIINSYYLTELSIYSTGHLLHWKEVI